MATFTKLKAAGLPKASVKFSKLTKMPKGKVFSMKAIKVPTKKIPSSFNLSKYTKLAKIPKSKKVTLLKSAIKKNVGF